MDYGVVLDSYIYIFPNYSRQPNFEHLDLFRVTKQRARPLEYIYHSVYLTTILLDFLSIIFDSGVTTLTPFLG